MAMASERDLLEEALALPVEQRARMVLELLRSLGPNAPAADAAWLQEIERRLREVDAGDADLESWEDVKKRLLRRWGHEVKG